MKALLICESQTELDTYNDFFKNNSFNTICYTWLLKALDNLLEINPDVVLINSIDYPRHWKTFVQYLRSMCTHECPVVLICSDDQSEDEQKKVDALKVIRAKDNFTFTGEGISILREIKEKINPVKKTTAKSEHKPIVDINLQEPSPTLNKNFVDEFDISTDAIKTVQNSDIQGTIHDSSESVFLSCPIPDSDVVITGTVKSYQYPILKFIPDNNNDKANFSFGKKIPSCTLSDDGIDSLITVQVQGLDDEFVELCIVK